MTRPEGPARTDGPRPHQGHEHPVGEYLEEHVLRQPHDSDWRWRKAIRARPHLLVAYRLMVALLGMVLVIGGLILVPLPGPGWLIVLLGLAVLASEFEPAKRLLDYAKQRLRQWDTWVRSQPLVVQLLIGAATAAFVLAVVWGTLRVSGIPGWAPDVVRDLLQRYAGLAG